MKGHGFARSENQNPMDPEYVKLQRAEVIKKYQDKVLALKSEINELQESKAILDSNLKNAFIAERSNVEELERKARERKEAADQEASIVRGLREDFEAEKKQTEEALAVREKDVQEKLEQNRNMLDAINAAHDRERTLALKNAEEAKAIEATKAELQNRILVLSQDRLSLEAEQLILRNAQAGQKSMNDVLAAKQLEISEMREAVQRASDEVEKRSSEVEAQLAVAQEAGREADQAILTLKELKAKTDADSVAVKLERQKLSEWERQLTIREKAFNNESAIRKRDLDDRESRIKSLEAKLGG